MAETTPAVARALDAARTAAAADGAVAVGPRHVLAGLLAESDGRAASWLREHGLNVARWQVPAAGSAHTVPDLPFAPAAARALDAARSLAWSDTADHVVTSDHVILALLRTDQEVAGLLRENGLNSDSLEASYGSVHAAPLSLHEPLDLADITDRADAARILDASANRAREALRVLEDYVRFSLDDAFLTRQFKHLRHDLTETLADLAPSALVAIRDTLRDVGTEISTQREQVRHSLRDVVQANLKRLQEALRSLEEYGKLFAPILGKRLEAVRYQAYTLERGLILGMNARQQLADARLYVLLSGAACRAALDWTIAEAAAGGAGVIQLREKGLQDRELLQRARDVRRWTR
jgi:thiamine-phosphate pyrophosphorylase